MKKKQPHFSMVIPTRARPDRLKECLDAIAQIRYPREQFEVIVVDDGSDESQETVVAQFRDVLDIKFFMQPHSGPAKARNTGAKHAKGNLLVFTDDDCVPAVDYLQRLEEAVAQNPGCALGGMTINTLSDNPYSTASQMLVDYLYAFYNKDPAKTSFLTSNNMVMPVKTFHAIGGFDEDFPLAAGEDRELCDRWLYHGHQIIFIPGLVVYHAHFMTFKKFWRQHFNYGCGAASFHEAHAKRLQESVKLESFFFYLNLLHYPYTYKTGIWPLKLTLLLVISQIANAMGFFRQVFKNKLQRLGF